MAAGAAFLSGLRVLDLSIWRPGPYATSLLVPLGADVLKVEPPGGDPMRHYPGLFAAINEGKRSLELNLKSTDDRARALDLATQADVVVEGFRPGVVARLGLDEASVRALNPGVVYCSISGYGQHDPRALLPGHDVNYHAWSGALTPEGGTATSNPPLPTADLAAGMTAAFGICAAVLGRMTSGEGTYLDVSMTDVLATWTGPAGARPADDAGDDDHGGAHPRVRPLLHGGRWADRAGRHERAALLGEPVRRARPRAGLRPRLRRTLPSGVPNSNTPSPGPSPPSPGTSWWPGWPPPACPSRRCSTAGACWRPPRSPGSRSGSPSPKQPGPSPRSTSTAAGLRRNPVDA